MVNNDGITMPQLKKLQLLYPEKLRNRKPGDPQRTALFTFRGKPALVMGTR